MSLWHTVSWLFCFAVDSCRLILLSIVSFRAPAMAQRQFYDRPSVHNDVIKWKHFPRYWTFVRGHRWISLTKASDAELWCFSLICAWISAWVNNREAGDLGRHCAHYVVIVLQWSNLTNMIRESHGSIINICFCMTKIWLLMFIVDIILKDKFSL